MKNEAAKEKILQKFKKIKGHSWVWWDFFEKTLGLSIESISVRNPFLFRKLST